jgi:hypothetical protein
MRVGIRQDVGHGDSSKRKRELDEEETAVAAAESGVWIPVHRPSNGHPFEIVLVVDRGASMRIWDQTADAVRALLERQGAFTDVRTVSVDTDQKTVRSLETAPGAACSPAQLSDPTGRRIILVLTDGVGPAWRSGSMFGLMTTAGRAPVSRAADTARHPRGARQVHAGLEPLAPGRNSVERATAPSAGVA